MCRKQNFGDVIKSEMAGQNVTEQIIVTNNSSED